MSAYTMQEFFSALRSRFAFTSSPSINLLVLFVSLLLSAFLIRLIFRRYRMRVSRDAIPYVIGGWGTRGKSGMERKKTALMEALGYNVLSKTTGCEAMVIHAEPGLDGIEIPIYRPGSKATIWEQEKVAGIARELQVGVMLWECMALAPDYAAIMQHDWMEDDFSTISNTFVDHENVQGPTGMDVARSMAAFIPANSTLYTAEESMLPILKQAAYQRGTELKSLPWYDSDLIADDVLSLFPYRVHPRNIGLVLKMAREMGVSDNFTLKEITERIIPDLGAFNKYAISYRSRHIEFWNGMSANDRTSCLGNWEQAGFNRNDDTENNFIVTVINNRDDRILRSREFSEIIVNDTPAHLHVLIGRNLNGMIGYLAEAIRSFCNRHALPGNSFTDQSELEFHTSIRRQLDDRLRLLRIDVRDPAAMALRLAGMMGSKSVTPQIQGCVQHLLETSPADRSAVAGVLHDHLDLTGMELSAVAYQLFVDLKTVHAVQDFMTSMESLRSSVPSANRMMKNMNSRFRILVEGLFMDRLLVIRDPFVSGDQIIKQLVDHTPPESRIRIMGIQNIKGTGLDFAYRWLSLARVQSAVDDLVSEDGDTRARAALKLADHDDYGILDAPLALEKLEKALGQTENRDPEIATVLKDALERVQQIHHQKYEALDARKSSRFNAALRRVAEQILEAGDSKRRYRKVKKVWRDLYHRRISHGRAAQILHEINKRQDGGWLFRK